MKTLKLLVLLAVASGTLALFSNAAFALGEASTKFNIWVPPNADNTARPTVLVIMAISPGATTVDVVDDATFDGESAHTQMGLQLQRGEAYIQYIKDGTVNHDASGLWNGDYFKINSDQPIVVYMASQSDWEHDWLPADNKTSYGKSFFYWTPPKTSDVGDLNLFSYTNGTKVALYDITTTAKTTSGKTTVNLATPTKIFETTLNAGEDLWIKKNLGTNILQDGRTYWIKSTNPITGVIGHLGQAGSGDNSRDGGGFIPSSNGFAIGELYYFTIPHNSGSAGEKELRIISYDAGSVVTLSGWNTTTSVYEQIWTGTLGANAHMDFVGSSNSAFMNRELYKVTVTPAGKRVSMFEANWLETSSASGTADVSSAVSANTGLSSAGLQFIAYVGPTSIDFNAGQSGPANTSVKYSHIFVYGHESGTSVTVQDVDNAGKDYKATGTLNFDKFQDFSITEANYNRMLRQGRRPYVQITASKPVSVIMSNWNDNWMTFIPSPLMAGLKPTVTTSKSNLACNDEFQVNYQAANTLATYSMNNVSLKVTLPAGLDYVSTASSDMTGPAVTNNADNSTTLVYTKSGALAPAATINAVINVKYNCAKLTTCSAGAGLQDVASMIKGAVTANIGDGGASVTDQYATADSMVVEMAPADAMTVSGFSAVYSQQTTYTDVAFTIDLQVGGATYEIQRSLTQTGTYATVYTHNQPTAVASPATINWEDRNIQPNTTYWYKLVATNDDGCSQTLGPNQTITDGNGGTGNNGGFESNGRLAFELAQRAILRSNNMWYYSPKILEVFGGGQSTDGLLSFVGPDGSTGQESTPIDIPALSNGKTSYSIDYYDDRGNIVATALIIETVGEVYEHSKNICDRANGSKIVGAEKVMINDREDLIIRTKFANDKTNVFESAMSFVVYLPKVGSMAKAYTAWDLRSYPKPEEGQTVLNVQVWAGKNNYDWALTDRILTALRSRGSLSWSMLGSFPDAAITKALTMSSKVSLAIDKMQPDSPETRELVLRINYFKESGREPVALEMPIGKISEPLSLEKTFEPFLEMSLELATSDGQPLDYAWISDGAWTYYNDSIWGGKTKMNDFSAADCYIPTGEEYAQLAADKGIEANQSAMRLAGCGITKADVAEFGGVARYIGGGFAPLDLTPFKTMFAYVSSDKPVEVCIETVQDNGFNAPCALLYPKAEGGFVHIDLSQLYVGKDKFTGALDAVKTIIFISKEKGAVSLQAGGLQFTSWSGAGADNKPLPIAAPISPVSGPYWAGCSSSNYYLIIMAALGLAFLALRRRTA